MNINKHKGNDLVNLAAGFASLKHASQIDDEGRPYYFAHLLPVAMILREVTDDAEVIAAGYLHDTIEDTDTTYEEIVEKFGQRVANLVMEVTHEGSKNEKGYYFPRLYSKEGIMIKFADRLSNLSRMGAWDAERQQHYLKRSKFWKSE